jgi:hypothetical protein
MITKKQKLQLAFLTGYTPVELRGEDPVEPSDDEIKNLIILLPNDCLHKIYVGKNGDRFKELCNAAMQRISLRDIPQPKYGRTTSAGLLENLEPHEVEVGTADPTKGK